jgi:two-component system response regulator HydG
LLESELFGHEKGAFTGAIERKIGKLESANGGTVLLDEVGELALPLQAKLLRAIEEREFERVGSARPLQVDIRFIAATNKDLAEASRNGKFRPDLFFRLNVIPLNMPPLRERPEDIPLLANHFVSKFSRRVRRRLMGISDAALECLVRYSWPGNVRELANAIERAVVLGSAELILPEELPCAVFERESGNDGARTKYETSLREAKSQAILNAIRQSGGNITEAAKLLGLHPNHLHRLIRKLNLRDQL